MKDFFGGLLEYIVLIVVLLVLTALITKGIVNSDMPLWLKIMLLK